MSEIEKLKQEIEEIKQRNRKVESDKAWETSMVRRLSVALVTYAFISLVFYSMGVNNPFFNAIVPTIGYLLSTLSLGLIRDAWVRTRNR